MFKLPEMPTIDFSSLKLPSFDFSAIDLPSIDFPSIDFSRFDVGALRDKLPKIDLPAIDTAKLTAAVRDAGYIAVGLGVVAVERAQARGTELTTTINDRLAEVREFIRSAV
jgi:hypothetical protein